MKRPIQLVRLRTVLCSRPTQRMAAYALQDIATAAIVACGYLLLFAHDSVHAHRWLWIVVLTLDAVVAFACSADLQGGAE